jgi:hypothetical protein
MKEQYQDIWINGRVKKGVRECESRYNAIVELLPKKPFTLLDIGANLGYFSFRIAAERPDCVCVLIEAHVPELPKIALANALPNVIVLKQEMNTELLSKLAKCEIFDVVLALNIAHHIGADCMNALEKLGELLIVETPNPKDKGSCGQSNLQAIYNKVSKYKKIGEFSRHTSDVNSLMGYKKAKRNKLQLKYWDADAGGQEGIEKISKQGDEFIKGNTKRNWIHGINYRSFQYLNGIYPTTEQIRSTLQSLDFGSHRDIAPWNIVISGQNLHLIDADDERHNKPQKEAIERLIKSVGRVEPISFY